jgi:nicotinate-nucleotide pyrophosphorylase
MSQTFEFYDERARAAEAEADKAVLDNVRERELRSAKAWRGMADRQLLIDAERVKADEIRAARRAAELEAAEASWTESPAL